MAASQSMYLPPFKHAEWWHKLDDGHIQCDLCPRYCRLKEGQQGLCFVRSCVNGKIVLTAYGHSSGFCIDPVEKKPLNHFYPGSSVLSFGTAGCNLACKFCQNWDISKSRETDRLSSQAMPELVVKAALANHCKSIAFTYNDPVIFMEYALDIAALCRNYNIKTIAVTAGYICEGPREQFFAGMDAANIDLKAFTERFYWKQTGGHLQVVLDALKYVHHETDVWLEITNLLIPGENDSEQEVTQMCEWVVENLGPYVPLHFTAFHPDWKMKNKLSTDISLLVKARNIAIATGLKYVYLGNIHDKEGQSTNCASCGEVLIGRDWYSLSEWNIEAKGACTACGAVCHGYFDLKPGSQGASRQAININDYQ